MKVAILVCLLCAVAVMEFASGQTACSTQEDCPDGSCCAGPSFAKRCRFYGGEMAQCEPPNRFNEYSTGCPCQEGLICSAIKRCQTA
uniref:GTx3-5 n=1 Tax=Grammostola rosea TaxID=432528 RepID=M5AY95_GRARO|nr:GTx3-5 [Grammostola rosea]